MLGQPPVLETEADSVVFPAEDGLVGILPGHAPLAAVLGTGPLTIRKGPESKKVRISGGVAYMNQNVLTILAEKQIEEPHA